MATGSRSMYVNVANAMGELYSIASTHPVESSRAAQRAMVDETILRLADIFAASNDRFNRDLFIKVSQERKAI